MASRRKADPKIALILAGGGIIGGVYEIGVLKALNDFMDGMCVSDFNPIVGTSCGAFVGSCLANGISPEEMMASLAGERVEGFRFVRRDLFRLNVSEMALRLVSLPWEVSGFFLKSVWKLRPFPPADLFYRLSKCLPSGIYRSDGIEETLREVFRSPRTNDFGELKRDLCVTATDIDSSRLRVFSREDAGGVPISRAVAASTSIPIVFKPVRIEGRDYVDGGLDDTIHVDLAVERGAKLLICVNPLVSYVKDGRRKGHHVLELGFPFVGKQVVRTILSTRVRYDLRKIRRRHPDVDILLIQPDEHDFQMFYNPIMKYASRVEIAVHGFSSASRRLARDFDKLESLFARHGISVRLDLLARELEAIEALGPRSRGAALVLEGVGDTPRKAPWNRGPLVSLADRIHSLEQTVAAQKQRKQASGA